MKDEFLWGATKILSLILLVVMAGVLLLQVDNFEARFIRSNAELKKLEEAQQRQAAELQRIGEALDRRDRAFMQAVDRIEAALSSGTVRPSATAMGPRRPERPEREWLHPEVENYLVPEDYPISSVEWPNDGELVRWWGSEPKGFNPITENSADLSEYVEAYVAPGLAERHKKDPDKWAPVLAERVEITDDFKLFTIYVRKGVKWHRPAVDWSDPRYEWLRGDHYLTAHDFKARYDTMMNPQVEAGFAKIYYQDIEWVKVLDDYTFQVKWKKKTYVSISSTLTLQPLARFVYLNDRDGQPFPKETFGHKFNEHWYNKSFIGTGPYRWVSYQPGIAVTLERNEEYWDRANMPAIKRIKYLIFPDRQQTLLKFKAKEIDFCALDAAQYRENVLENEDPTTIFKNGQTDNTIHARTSYYYIGWNADKPIFADKRVRRAMTMAMNRPFLIRNVLMGLGAEISGPFHDKDPHMNKSIEPWPYDLEKARALLEEAGWKDVDDDGILEKKINGELTEFEFTMLSYKSPTYTPIVNVFKEDLYKIGVKLNGQFVDWAVMQKKMEDKEFDAFTGGWGMTWDGDPYQIWHSSCADIPKGSNRVGFRNREVDDIIETLRETFDQKKRTELFHRFHQILHEEQPYTFFFSAKSCYVWWDHVKNVHLQALRPHDWSLPWYVTAH